MKILLQKAADPARLAIEQERLKIERARFEAETDKGKQKPLFAKYLGENFLAFVAALVSLATLALSASQVWVAQINKDRDLVVLRVQQDKEWRYKALEFISNKSEVFYGSDPGKAKQMSDVFAVGFPPDIANEMLGKIQNSASAGALHAIHDARQELRSFSYLDWEGRPRRAEIRGETFVIALKDQSDATETVKALKYLTWNGSKWEAVIENGTFRHMPNGDASKAHPDTILNYLNWDGAPSTKSLFYP